MNTNCSWLLDTTWFLLWAKVGILNTTLTIWVLAITPSWLPYEKDKYSGSNSQCGNWSNHRTNNNPFGTWKTWEEQHINICLQKLYVWDPPLNHFSHDAFFYAYNFFLFNLRQITQKSNKMWVWYPQEEVQLSIRAKLKAFHQYPSLTYSLWPFKNN